MPSSLKSRTPSRQFAYAVQGFPKSVVELAARGAEGGAALYDFFRACVELADSCGVGCQALGQLFTSGRQRCHRCLQGLLQFSGGGSASLRVLA